MSRFALMALLCLASVGDILNAEAHQSFLHEDYYMPASFPITRSLAGFRAAASPSGTLSAIRNSTKSGTLARFFPGHNPTCGWELFAELEATPGQWKTITTANSPPIA